MLTGYPILDHLTGGLQSGDLLTLVGGPLVGRSMFALNILRNQMDFETSPKIAFMTAELSAKEAERRLLQLAIDVEEGKRMEEQFVFTDIQRCCIDFESLHKNIIKLVGKNKVSAVIIDSFHFLPFIEYYSYDKLPNISRKLKVIARELGIVIIITTRTNYQPSERSGLCGKRPCLSDLEYMGDLNYFSDVVLGMFRPEMYNMVIDIEGNRLEGNIQVEILKSRKTIMQLISYQIVTDKGQIEEMELLDRHKWL